MIWRDRAVVVGLLAVLGILTLALALPTLAGPVGGPAEPSPSLDSEAPYREGMVGRPSAVSPFAAVTPADRALVRLAFSGLVRLGPDGSLVPDLAERWSVDEAGTSWTFNLRDDAVWHDGEPVTARDVLFTVAALKDDHYTGPGGASWRDVTARIVDDRTVVFSIGDPIGGFLYAATQPIAPEHILGDVPADLLPTHPFNQQPVGSGPYRVVSWSASRAQLEAFEPNLLQVADGPVPAASAVDSLATSGPTARPGQPIPYLTRIELEFYSTPAELAEALASGTVDAAAGLPPGDAIAVAGDPSLRLIRYPTTTLTTVLLDVRPTRTTFRDARVRRGLLSAIDRDRLVATTLSGLAVRADAPIPPDSWAFDGSASEPIAYDPAGARKLLAAGGWRATGSGWTIPGVEAAGTVELLAPDESANRATHAAAEAVASDWRALGIGVTVVHLTPTELAARVEAGDYEAAVVDLAIGLDPDLYPLLASTQTIGDGANLSGLQDPALDRLLEAARAPGSVEERLPAFRELQAYLRLSQPMLPLAFRDEAVVAVSDLQGPTPRLIGETADRFYDVVAWRLADGR
jgi:peptide/nickel transport system substrate-binding protein